MVEFDTLNMRGLVESCWRVGWCMFCQGIFGGGRVGIAQG